MALNIKKDFGSTRQRKPDLTTLVYGKVPPQAPDLEEAILGACMLERDTFEQVMEVIQSEEVFYVDAHQKLFGCMARMYNNGEVIDLLTITEGLRKTNDLEIIGGASFLTRLTRSVLSSAHVKEHAYIVFEKFVKRESIRICGSIIGDAYNDNTDAFEILEMAETQLKEITAGIISGNATNVGDTYIELLMDIEEQKVNKTEIIGVPSGYVELDRLTLGWQKTELIILAARPSQGKTAMALNFAINSKVPTLLFSLESSKKALVRRLAAAKNKIPLECIRTGNLDDAQQSVMTRAIADFRKLPIKIDDRSRKLETIKKVARKWRKSLPAGCDAEILIDYLQLMSVAGKGNREQEISTISRDLKELAVELDVPIIALSQLNREVEKTANKKPGLANLREGGSIEQDANIVMFIWWQDMGEGVANTYLLVEKNRDGKCGPVQLKFNGDIQKWLNYDDFEQAIPASFIANNYQKARDPSEPNISWEE